MSIFSSILQKLGLKKKEEPASPSAAPVVTAPKASVAPAPKPAAPAAKASTPAAKSAEPTFTPTANFRPNAISEVDVVAHLEKLAAGSPGLDWKVSIVDLMKLLGLDSSLAARKELATELGCPADAMADSARMNVWLHKTVLKKVAENGGNIPQSLL
ncbi:MAG: DUF3597 domain-containing protein [Chloroflexi bacterium]|nr:DUF3597 domain-containing protein [Chloroflexota bacterium]